MKLQVSDGRGLHLPDCDIPKYNTKRKTSDVVREIENRNPGLFGPNGGYSRAYSLTNLSWNIGLLAGTLLSGSLVQAIGYYYMNFTLGERMHPEKHPRTKIYVSLLKS